MSTRQPPYASFQPVLRLADFPKVWVKIGDYQIASQQPFPWPDTAPFVAELRRAFGPERMIWGTGYAGGGRLVPLAQALEYVQRHLPLSADDLDLILDKTPRALFGFRVMSDENESTARSVTHRIIVTRDRSNHGAGSLLQRR